MASEESPAWAKQLLQRPLIEIRRGISFNNNPPTETSSVLALTAPSGKFVDIRIANNYTPTPISSFTKPPFDRKQVYATAGLATATMPTPASDGSCPAYECTAHVTWRHDIDSSSSVSGTHGPISSTDGADMYLLGNGDVMEVGVYTAPDGKVNMFKEYWPTMPASVPRHPCVVAECGTRGMVVRIGDYCQGVLRVGEDEYEEFWWEKWTRGEDAGGGDGGVGGWVKYEKSNTNCEGAKEIACLWVAEESRKLGDTVALGDLTWTVTEVVEEMKQ